MKRQLLFMAKPFHEFIHFMPSGISLIFTVPLPGNNYFFYHVSCVIAIITGIVSIDRKLTSATVLDAVAVSLP